MSETRVLGYWIVARDEASAAEAVRMSGLPVLLMGLNSALLALITLTGPLPNLTLVAASAVIALLMIILAFRIRAGHAAWIPIVLILYAGFIGMSVFSSLISWQLAGGSPAIGTQFVLGWIIPAICLVLVIAGYKGWRWLVAHKVKVTF